MIKQRFFVLLVSFICANVSAIEQDKAKVIPLDEVIAVVNEEVITKKTLSERVFATKKKFSNDPNAPVLPSDEILQKEVLNALVQEMVIKQFAKNNNLLPSSRQVKAVLQAQIEASGKNKKMFVAELLTAGLTTSLLKEQIKLQMAVSRVRNKVIAPTIKVREAEIDSFLSERLGSNTKNPEVSVAHIVIKVPETTTDAENIAIAARIETIKKEMNSGAEFTDIAARFSDFADARKGGLLGWRPSTRLPDIYQQALTNMKPGEVSEVMKSPNGYHVIKLIEERRQSQQEVERIRARHILLRVDEGQSEGQAINEIEKLAKRLKEGASFADLAMRHSQDGSAKIGGDLGWLYPGDTVSVFEQALVKLAIGKISPPVRTQFGYHLIQTVARESVPLPEDKARKLAKRTLTDERMISAFQRWLDEQVALVYLKSPR